MAGRLSDELRKEGFMPTGRESPVSEEGELWSNGYDVVCDETATLIDGNHYSDEDYSDEDDEEEDDEEDDEKGVYRYRNSNRVMLPGGHVSSYDWGHDEDDRFRY